MLATKPNAKIGVLYQDDGFGRDYMVGLKEGLGATHARMIVATATYETGAETIDPQVVTLRRRGADIFLIVAAQELAEQAINKAFDIGWTPVRYVTGVSQSISSTMTPAGREKLKGAITAVYDKDPTEARWRDDPGFGEYAAFITKYMSRAERDDARVVNGFGVAATMVHVLKQCGPD